MISEKAVRLRTMAGDFFWYGGGNVLQKAAGFLLLPLFTRFLGPSDYGVLEIANILVAGLAAVAVLGQNESVARFYFEFDGARRKRLLGCAIAVSGAFSLVLAALMIVEANSLAPALFGTDLERPVLALALVALRIPFHVLGGPALLALRMERRRASYLSLTFLTTLLDIGLSIELIARQGTGLHGFLAASLIASGFQIAVGLFLLRGAFQIALPERAPLRFGLILMPAALITLALFLADRILLALFSDVAALGLYGIAGKFAGLVWLAQASLSLAWTPLAFRWAAEDDHYRIRTASSLCVAFLFTIAAGVSIIARDLLPLMTPDEFHAAVFLVPGATLAAACAGAATIGRSVLMIAKKTSMVLFAELAALAIHLGLSYILIRNWGAFGASIGVCAAFGVSACLSLWLAGRAMPGVAIPIREFLAIAIVTALIVAVAVAVNSPILRYLLGGILLIVMGLFVYRHPLLADRGRSMR